MVHGRVYAVFLHLYPREFRREYGDVIELHFADLVADRGARAAWARTTLDLAITIPRYHLEQIMTDRRSTATLNIAIVLLATAGLASLLVGAWPGLIFLIAAGALAIAQRSSLAHALRVPDTDQRRGRLRAAAILGGIFVVSFGAYLLTVGDTWTVRDTVLSGVGTLALFGAGGFLVAGLATHRMPGQDGLAGSR